MKKEELLALLKEYLTIDIHASAGCTQDSEPTIDVDVYIYFDDKLVAEGHA